MLNDIFYTIISGSILSSISLILSYIKEKSDTKSIKKENEEIKEKVESVKELADGEANVLDLMLKNVSELREYYVISKNQARRSFSSALLICFFGIVIYSFGIISVVFLEADATLITIVSGTVVEIISGLFFWLYMQASKQLDIYHKRLGTTEKYLTAMQLIEKMSENEKDSQYDRLILHMITDGMELPLSKEENK